MSKITIHRRLKGVNGKIGNMADPNNLLILNFDRHCI